MVIKAGGRQLRALLYRCACEYTKTRMTLSGVCLFQQLHLSYICYMLYKLYLTSYKHCLLCYIFIRSFYEGGGGGGVLKKV